MGFAPFYGLFVTGRVLVPFPDKVRSRVSATRPFDRVLRAYFRKESRTVKAKPRALRRPYVTRIVVSTLCTVCALQTGVAEELSLSLVALCIPWQQLATAGADRRR